VARLTLPSITLVIDGDPEHSSTTIGTVGGYAVVVATALPDRGVTLTSCYLAEAIGDIAASHMCSAPAHSTRIEQRVIGRDQPGETHARVCVLDHVAELQTMLAELVDAAVTIDVGPDALQRAADAWTPHEPTGS